MPDNKNFAFRLEIIDECLRNRYRKWTLQNLIDTVNLRLTERFGKSASRRTIQDDLRYLQENKDAPIEKNKIGTTTYFSYGDANFSIKNLPISDEEITLLADAINILRQVNDFKILGDVDEIVNKLQNTVSTNIEGGLSLVQFEKQTTAIGIDYIDDIFSAIKSQLSLRVTYQSFKANKAEQSLFHPYLLKEYRNRWFIIGRKNNSEFITILALDRIKEIKLSAEAYISNNLFDHKTYFNNVIGVSFPENEKVQLVQIKVSPSQAPYIRTKPFHHTQEIVKEYKNGSILIGVWLINNYELRSVILSFGADLEVLKPLSLRNQLKKTLMKAIEKYK